jgi:L-aspartate oxidase
MRRPALSRKKRPTINAIANAVKYAGNVISPIRGRVNFHKIGFISASYIKILAYTAKMRMPRIIETDYLVIGSGLAGLYFAAHASEHGSVAIVTKRKVKDTTTYLAQAGIAAVLGPDDSLEEHIKDTIKIGAGLCNEKIVSMVVGDSAARIKDLHENFQVPFTLNSEGDLDLGLEGGHSKRRVARVDDFTGISIMNKLDEKVRSKENIQLLEDHMAVDLLSMSKYGEANSCFGAFVLDRRTNNIDIIIAKATILATGGAGKAYLYTSNPDTSAGDGIAMGYRIGAEVSNMEFFQFHPTILYHPNAKSFLISEALRGEGGRLVRSDGTPFMAGYSSMGDLAPRDIVARAIDHELKLSGGDSVFLDISHRDSDFIKRRFPNIYKKCLEFQIDITKERIPVVPAAHYSCGGVQTDEYGATNIPNLFAIGEVAHTGFHGACRMASNSLIEALVFAHRTADRVKKCVGKRPKEIIPWKTGRAITSDEGVVVAHTWDEIRRTMWNYVGIVRSDKRLKRATERLAMIRNDIHTYYWDFLVTAELLELRNLALVADLIVFGASRRLESRGLHYNINYPETSSFYQHDTILKRGMGPQHRFY